MPVCFGLSKWIYSHRSIYLFPFRVAITDVDQYLISQKMREELEEAYLEANVPNKLVSPASNTVLKHTLGLEEF